MIFFAIFVWENIMWDASDACSHATPAAFWGFATFCNRRATFEIDVSWNFITVQAQTLVPPQFGIHHIYEYGIILRVGWGGGIFPKLIFIICFQIRQDLTVWKQGLKLKQNEWVDTAASNHKNYFKIKFEKTADGEGQRWNMFVSTGNSKKIPG